MTTLSWDGHTLAADTRITYVQLEPTAGGLGNQIKSVDSANDDHRKIMIPKTIIFAGERVHAIAFGGDTALMQVFLDNDTGDQEIGQLSLWEHLMTTAHVKMTTTLVFITQTRVHAVEMDKDTGKVTILTNARNISITVAMHEHTRKFGQAGLSAKHVVMHGYIEDKYTGPNVDCWTPESGIVRTISSDTIRQRKKRLIGPVLAMAFKIMFKAWIKIPATMIFHALVHSIQFKSIKGA